MRGKFFGYEGALTEGKCPELCYAEPAALLNRQWFAILTQRRPIDS